MRPAASSKRPDSTSDKNTSAVSGAGQDLFRQLRRGHYAADGQISVQNGHGHRFDRVASGQVFEDLRVDDGGGDLRGGQGDAVGGADRQGAVGAGTGDEYQKLRGPVQGRQGPERLRATGGAPGQIQNGLHEGRGLGALGQRQVAEVGPALVGEGKAGPGGQIGGFRRAEQDGASGSILDALGQLRKTLTEGGRLVRGMQDQLQTGGQTQDAFPDALEIEFA
jgi:hypothetical protein